MNRNRRPQLRTFALAAALGLMAVPASAQYAGTWVLRGGAGHIAPDVTSGALSAPSVSNLTVSVDNASTVVLGATYFIDDDISVDLTAGLPFKHALSGDGSARGAGVLSTTRVAAPAVALQYRFGEARSPLRPYLGLALTYAHFYDEQGNSALTAISNPGGPPTSLSIDGAIGAGLQIGASVQLQDRWSLDLNLSKLFLKTTATLSTGQTIDVKLDPLVTTLTVGYRF